MFLQSQVTTNYKWTLIHQCIFLLFRMLIYSLEHLEKKQNRMDYYTRQNSRVTRSEFPVAVDLLPAYSIAIDQEVGTFASIIKLCSPYVGVSNFLGGGAVAYTYTL